jgi:hypothetical protein
VKVHIFEYGDWCAIYRDGKLVHWHDTPGPGALLRNLGIDCEYDVLPEPLQKAADDGGSGSHWSPPRTMEEMGRILQKIADDEVAAEIKAIEERLAELRSRQKKAR